MSEQPEVDVQARQQILARLHEVAQLVRETRHLDLEGQQAVADLVDELSKAIGPEASPSTDMAHLADSVAHLAQVLHQRHEKGVVAAARERLEQAAVRVETEAPLATGLARRFLDALADWGI